MCNVKLLLCTDMDRTVIPNGPQPEHPEARRIFTELSGISGVELVYVTGRHLELVEDAIAKYRLPKPSFVVSDVGTKIYKNTSQGYRELNRWQEEIAQDWRGKSARDLQQHLSSIDILKLQEPTKQSNFKLSFYVPIETDHEALVLKVGKKLEELSVSASLIFSIDEEAQVGLLDVLPENATKLHGLNFLRQYLGYTEEETIFAGDSGNDLPVLESSVRSILVANATLELQKQAKTLVEQKGNSRFFYQATDNTFSLGGNYSAGVIQGVIHYMPKIKSLLNLT